MASVTNYLFSATGKVSLFKIETRKEVAPTSSPAKLAQRRLSSGNAEDPIVIDDEPAPLKKDRIRKSLQHELIPTEGDPANRCDYKIKNILFKDIIPPTERIAGKLTRQKAKALAEAIKRPRIENDEEPEARPAKRPRMSPPEGKKSESKEPSIIDVDMGESESEAVEKPPLSPLDVLIQASAEDAMVVVSEKPGYMTELNSFQAIQLFSASLEEDIYMLERFARNLKAYKDSGDADPEYIEQAKALLAEMAMNLHSQ